MTISLKTKAAGNANLDLVFDPYVQGTHPAATGLLADASLGGGDIANRYAPIVYGSAAAPTGLLTKQAGHADINTLFAAYGTANYPLPINGTSYIRSKGRGTASLSFNMSSTGAYSITNDLGSVLASGTWLPGGDSVSSYTCLFTTTMSSGPDPGGGFTAISNGAPTQSSLTTTRVFTGSATATTTGTTATNSGTVTMYLYKSGVLRSTTFVNFECDAAG